MKGDIICVARLQGVVAHDATTESNVGLGNGGVDILIKTKWKIRYNGNLPIKYFAESGVGSVDTLTTPSIAGPAVDITVEEG